MDHGFVKPHTFLKSGPLVLSLECRFCQNLTYGVSAFHVLSLSTFDGCVNFWQVDVFDYDLVGANDFLGRARCTTLDFGRSNCK